MKKRKEYTKKITDFVLFTLVVTNVKFNRPNIINGYCKALRSRVFGILHFFRKVFEADHLYMPVMYNNL